MSLRTLLPRSLHPILTFVSLAGVATIPFIQPNATDEARGLLQLGRAYERRDEIQAKVMRHNDYRRYVKNASGARLRIA